MRYLRQHPIRCIFIVCSNMSFCSIDHPSASLLHGATFTRPTPREQQQCANPDWTSEPLYTTPSGYGGYGSPSLPSFLETCHSFEALPTHLSPIATCHECDDSGDGVFDNLGEYLDSLTVCYHPNCFEPHFSQQAVDDVDLSGYLTPEDSSDDDLSDIGECPMSTETPTTSSPLPIRAPLMTPPHQPTLHAAASIVILPKREAREFTPPSSPETMRSEKPTPRQTARKQSQDTPASQENETLIFATEADVYKRIPMAILQLNRSDFNLWEKSQKLRSSLSKPEKELLSQIRRKILARGYAKDRRLKDKAKKSKCSKKRD